MQTTIMTNAQLYGLDESKLVACDFLATQKEAAREPARLHQTAATAFKNMQRAAAQAGLKLQIASGFRSFAHQQLIWERKYQHPSRQEMTATERMSDILRWSALPGTSRHHWGTDFDAYDSSAIERSQLTLEPWEFEQGGPCHELYLWLEKYASHFGFYRPYDHDRGGVAPEPWHWSYAPLSTTYVAEFNTEHLRTILVQAQLSGLVSLAPHLDSFLHEYVQNYVMNVATATL